MITADQGGKRGGPSDDDSVEALVGTFVHDLNAPTAHEVLELARQLQSRTHQLEAMQASSSPPPCSARELCDLAPVGYVSLDADGMIREINVAGAEMLAEERACLIGRRLGEWTVDSSVQTFDAHLRECIGSDEQIVCEVTLIAGDGRHVPVLLRSVREDNGSDGSVTCRTVMVDLSHRKHIEQELRDSQRMLQAVLDTILVRVFWKDRDLRYLGCNKAFAHDAGVQLPEQIVGRFDTDMVWAEQAEMYNADDRQVMNTGQPKLNFEEPQTTPQGDRIWLATTKIPLRDEDGNISGVMGTYEDITERKQAEEALRESEQKYRNLFETAMVGLYRTRLSDGKFLAVNATLARIMGYESVAEIEAGGITTSDHYADVHRRDELLRQLTEKGRVDGFEITGRRRDGSIIEIAISAKAYPELGYMEGAVVDLTDRKRAEREKRKLEAQVQHAQKLESLGVLAGGIAHDFNNLLVAILGNADLAVMDLPEGGAERTSLEEIKMAAKRASELTNQMLAYSGKGQFLITMVDLNELVKEMGHLLDVSITKRAILTYDLVEPLPPIEADASQIRQVVMNLITNASDAVRVFSEPGQGSIFRILFPAATGQAEQPAESVATDETTPIGGTVLVVDDEDSVRKVAGMMLRRSGFDVLEAVDGREAVEVFERRGDTIDVVLLDMTMPRMGGHEAFEAIRRIRPDAKVILCSGYSEQDARDQFPAQGLAGFIQKPYELKKLTSTLRSVLAGAPH